MKEKKYIYKIASLFSGCGGLDLGFIGGFDYWDDISVGIA